MAPIILKCFLLFLPAFLACILQANGDENLASVVLGSDGKTLVLKPGYDSSQPMVAWGKFDDKINYTGWAFLEIHSNTSLSDTMQAKAAGMTEGSLTAELMHKSYQNTLASFCNADPQFCEKLGKFLDDNLKWISEQIASNPTDKYWYQINLILQQFEGIKEGYLLNKGVPSIDDLGFLLIQADGDLFALEQALGKKKVHHVFGSGSCSALIKLLPGNKDLYISQVTWTSYAQLLRVFKLYDFPFTVNGNKGATTAQLHPGWDTFEIDQGHVTKNQPITMLILLSESIGEIIPGRKASFSSYPGLMTSGDDFYLLSSGMVSQETTIGNSNPELWKYVYAEGIVLEWMRTLVANRLARTAAEWTYFFGTHNSGTYNNQWMVLDYKLFTPGGPIIPGTLLILEQLPGIVEVADMSVFLQEKTYWASYNIPYFPYIYNMSGARESYEKYGSWFSYDGAPRAQMFKRDHSKVVDMDSMMKLMRYNDYKHDPLARCNCTPPYSGENAISSRSDLNPADGKYPIEALGHRQHGGIDAKVTNSKMVKTLQCMAVSGPTHDQQPVFKWSTSGWKRPMGHPDAWDFEPITVTWDVNLSDD